MGLCSFVEREKVDSKEIIALCENGKIVQAKEYLNRKVDSVTEKRSKQINMDFELFKQAKALLDKKRRKDISIKKKDGKISYSCTKRAFKFASYGKS